MFILDGSAFGEAMDDKKHNLKTEVKGATYSGLKIEKRKDFTERSVFWMFEVCFAAHYSTFALI
ncbi:MAG: archease [Candidatus Diapherotrites archaeon]